MLCSRSRADSDRRRITSVTPRGSSLLVSTRTESWCRMGAARTTPTNTLPVTICGGAPVASCTHGLSHVQRRSLIRCKQPQVPEAMGQRCAGELWVEGRKRALGTCVEVLTPWARGDQLYTNRAWSVPGGLQAATAVSQPEAVCGTAVVCVVLGERSPT